MGIIYKSKYIYIYLAVYIQWPDNKSSHLAEPFRHVLLSSSLYLFFCERLDDIVSLRCINCTS